MNINMESVSLEDGGEGVGGGGMNISEESSFNKSDGSMGLLNDPTSLVKRTPYPFNAKFWAYIRGILANAKPVGFDELPDPKKASPKGPEDANNFLQKVIGIGPLNPIQPAVIAKEGGFDEDEVLAELFYAVNVGLVAMRFAPECIQCGSAVMDTDLLGRVPSRALCGGCNQPNVIESMVRIGDVFFLS